MTSVALADELLLLAYDDVTGRSSVPPIALDLGMAAAILVDLVLHRRVEIADGTVVPIDPRPTGHGVADDVLRKIQGELPLPAAFWLQRLRHGLRQHILESMVAQGMMRDQDDTAWDILRVHHYPAVDPTVEQEVRGRLAEALSGASVPDERTAALAALVVAVRMEAVLDLTGDAVATAHQRLEEIVEAARLSPSVVYLTDALHRAVRAALGPVRQSHESGESQPWHS
jgi:hypothetical protein